MPALAAVVPTELHFNEANLGFVATMNAGFARATRDGQDVIMLNSDVVVFAGAFTEMQQVAYSDHMIGFVSPRSNNATICSLPNAHAFRHRSVAESRASFERIASYLPRVRYVPTAVGFCMYIKRTILVEFGLFDEIYGKGYSEENDLVMRANRCGYRAAMANHAFVYHIGEKSFGLTGTSMSERELRNARILRDRYPEYGRSVVRADQSAAAQVEAVLTGLLPDKNGRLTIAFDWTNFGTYHNGTFEAGKAILVAAARLWRNKYNIVVIGDPEAAAFHGANEVPGVVVVPYNQSKVYAAIVRIGQPFHESVVEELAQHAPVVAVYMLDTISLDCQYLDHNDLQRVWQSALDCMDLVVYISEYSQDQFRARFRISDDLIEVASLLSLDVSEYGSSDQGAAPTDAILIVGNHFAHKNMDPAIRRIVSEFPNTMVNVLGSTSVQAPNVRLFVAGTLDDDAVDRLYREARVVLFPSHYEGFGFPILHALARKRPVVVHAMPLNDELVAALGSGRNIHQCETTEEMVRLTCAPSLKWQDEPRPLGKGQGWDRVAADLDRGLDQALSRVSYRRLASRFERTSELRALRHAAAQGPGTIAVRRSTAVRPLAAAVTAIAWAAMICVLASTLFMVARGYSAIPFWDQLQYVAPEDFAARYFHFHNEHGNFIQKFLLGLDANVFGARNVFLFAMILLIQAGHCVVLTLIAMKANIRGNIRDTLVVATTICFLFGAAHYENFTWGFQTAFVLVFAAASAAFLLLSMYAESGRLVFLLGAVAAGVTSGAEMANGVLTLPLMFGLGLAWRLPRKALVLILVAAIAVIATYASQRLSVQGDPGFVTSHVGQMVIYALVYLGQFLGQTIAFVSLGPVFGSGEQASIVVSAVLGGGMLSFMAFALLVLFRHRDRARPAVLALFAIFAFVVGTALITAIGRVSFGLETALTSRYSIGSALASVACIFIALWMVPNQARLVARAGISFAVCAALVLIALLPARYVVAADDRRISRDAATAALYAGVMDQEALRAIFANPQFVASQIRKLEPAHRSIFADERYLMLGRKLPVTEGTCLATVEGERRMEDGAVRIFGEASVNPFTLRRPMVFVTDAQDVVVGIGFVSLRASQLGKIQIKSVTQRVPWQGVLVAGAQGPFRAMMSTADVTCHRSGS